MTLVIMILSTAALAAVTGFLIGYCVGREAR